MPVYGNGPVTARMSSTLAAHNFQNGAQRHAASLRTSRAVRAKLVVVLMAPFRTSNIGDTDSEIELRHFELALPFRGKALSSQK